MKTILKVGLIGLFFLAPMTVLAEEKEVVKISQRDQLAIQLMAASLNKTSAFFSGVSEKVFFNKFQNLADEVLKEIRRQQEEKAGEAK
jgi:hypothetical protein